MFYSKPLTCVCVLLVIVGCQTSPQRFPVVETSIAEIHAAMSAGDLTTRELVEEYLRRIEAYDKQGPALNSIITINPRALARADELDEAWAATGPVGPLHGIPIIVKDNYDTHDMPTTGGSLSLIDSVPPDDAFQVRRIREAGAIVLVKSNMAEFAFSPLETVGSALPGYTRNPYALNRVTAGSSGGTAAAVAASLGVVGLGTDTGNSIRGPASHNLLVGIRSTMGLTSRDGIIPLSLDHDIGGPLARTVTDAVAVFDVIAGYDAADPVTAASLEHKSKRYADYLLANGLDGARIGVVRQLSNTDTTDPEIIERFNEALKDMEKAGATIVDPVEVPTLEEIQNDDVWCARFEYDLNAYLASLGPDAPVKSLAEVVETGDFHPSIAAQLRRSERRELEGTPETNDGCLEAASNRVKYAQDVHDLLQENRLDALVYPTWSNPPRLIGDLNTPGGDNSQELSPYTGFPAITVPMGFVRGTLPVGIQFLGDAWAEPVLIKLTYSYEQATRHRVPPKTTPELR